jgi:phenylacetate-CoA ligase
MTERSLGGPRGLDPYAGLVDRALFPIWETLLKRRKTLHHRALLAKSERWSLDELRQLQQVKLKKLLSHAYLHVPHYRERFFATDFHPDQFRSLEDLERLPILSREEAQATVEARTSLGPPEVAYRALTGGTLGSSLSFGYDRETEAWRQAARLRAWGWAGYRVGARTLYYVGVNHGLYPPKGEQLRTLLERRLKRERYVSCMVRDDPGLERLASELRQKPPAAIVCYPRACADFARYVCERGLRSWPDIAILCHGEKLFESDRRAIREAFGPRVFETYACREMWMVASECQAHDGLHVTMENVLVEVLVRERDRVRRATPGETGEVVLTDLNNLAMPFIRYAIGDVAPAVRYDGCACGRTLPRLQYLEGRTVETLRGPAGKRISSTLFEQIMMNTLGATMKEFQIIQRRGGAIVLKIVPARGFTDHAVERTLDESRAMVPGLEITAEVVPALPHEPTGKRRVVLVEAD